MSDEMKGLVDDIVDIKKRIKKGKEYIKILENAGEDTVTAKAQLRAVETRAKKWEDSLKASGLSVPEE